MKWKATRFQVHRPCWLQKCLEVVSERLINNRRRIEFQGIIDEMNTLNYIEEKYFANDWWNIAGTFINNAWQYVNKF